MKFTSARAAREQAAESLGFLASAEIVLGDETYEIPQRGLLDDDQRDRMNELELETESWDHEDPVTLADGTVLPGRLKTPHRKANKLVKPAYPVRVATAIFGPERYEKFKAAGGRASDVTALLAMMDKRVEERERVDPKSGVGDSDGGPVGGADRD